MPKFSTMRIPHFAAVLPFNLTDPTGRPLYMVEHLVNEQDEIVGMICEGARPTERCMSCGDVDEDPTIRGTFTGHKFATPWNRRARPNDVPEFELVASIQGDNARQQVLAILTEGTDR